MTLKISFINHLNLALEENHFNRFMLLKSYRVTYYKTGCGQAMIGSGVHRFTEGMFAVVGPNEIFEDIATARTEECICEFTVESGSKKLPSGLYYDRDGTILKQLGKIQREFRNDEPYCSELLDLFSGELYYRLLRSLNKRAEKTNTIQDIVQYIDENFYDDLKIESLAGKTGYTCRHFRTLFTAKVGSSPSEYLLSKRMEYAQTLLCTTGQSIVEISQASGFSSSSQFAMLFKRHAGQTPSEYRNRTGTVV